MDGMDGNMAIFDDWAACNPSPRTYEFFSKDFVPRPILDSGEDDSQSSSTTMDFEKKKPPISFEEGGKKMGLGCTSDDSSELIGFNVQKSCLKGVHNEKMAEMARFNMLKAFVSQSDQENIMFEVNSSQNESKNLISSLPEESSSYILLSPGVSPTSMEYLDKFSVSLDLPNSNASLQENFKLLEPFGRKENTHDIVANQKASHFLDVNGSPPPPPPDDHQNAETGVNVEFSSFPECDPTKDGYNWRKYGQKQLKGCEFPCSYHKCTHPNCPVKKKIERSLQGHITEIIYKGSHNHPKPPSNHRSSFPSSKQLHGPQSDSSYHPGSVANFKGNPSWASTQDGFKGPEWSDGSGVSIDKEDNEATHGSLSVDYNIDQEEMESKRRKQELCPIGRTTTSRAMRDRRIVVQIPSDLDIPYDGYRWRKYGQKVVKGNPNPRHIITRPWDRVVAELCVATIENIIIGAVTCVQTQGGLTKYFPISVGLHQGSALSPYLFALVMDVLTRHLQEVVPWCMLFADDILLVDKTREGVEGKLELWRSYYKCTNRGCSVRKHVERASDDLNSVICTYEGKHNHDVPSARNINLARYFPSSLTATAAMQLPSLHTRPELAQDSFMSLENCAPICTYGLLGRGQQLGPTTSFSFGFDQSNLVSLCPSGSDLMRRFTMPFFPPIHQNMDRQVSSGNIIPMREPKNEPI
ncbi:hypothetical protein M5K25_011539 [Dendrobium thyrsiflorum]|uniref:WRKY domain-containing protein n=1 Tax=Dendrobium thyrsiflorum TaxID=117978 RepID=A0ABD0V3R7_DENTH